MTATIHDRAVAGQKRSGAETSDNGSPPRPRIVTSDDLLQGRRELWIEHGQDMYRLRLTASGKLYLTK